MIRRTGSKVLGWPVPYGAAIPDVRDLARWRVGTFAPAAGGLVAFHRDASDVCHQDVIDRTEGADAGTCARPSLMSGEGSANLT